MAQEQESTNFKVSPQQQEKINNVVQSIKKGFELLEIDGENELPEAQRLEYTNSIILRPDYQREYRFSANNESSLIESIFVGIPIPPIFLASARYRGVKVFNVVDGHHRLTAFYRFFNNDFKLENLKLCKELEDKFYRDLSTEGKEIFISYPLSEFVFENFPGKEFEIEIFSRYNRGTKQLTEQEIRNAVYASPFNDFVNKFVLRLYESEDDRLKDVYNVTKDRFLKKKVHEAVFTILSVLEQGIDIGLKNSTSYAEKYTKEKSEQEEDAQYDMLENQKVVFQKFNAWVLRFVDRGICYPFSKEIYGICSHSYKFQTSLAMILAAVYKKFYIDSSCVVDFDVMYMSLSYALSKSFLEDKDYTASSTNSRKIQEFVTSFELIR